MRFFCIGFLAFAAISLSAFGKEYTIDPSHSTVGFEIKHLVSKVRGQFDTFEGTFSYDEKKPEAFKLNTKIQTKSINTSNKKRDEHLRSGDFFDAAKNPTITYVGKKVTQSVKDKFKVLGDLTMRGVTKPVELDVEVTGEMIDPAGDNVSGLSIKGKLNRKDFGIVWNKALDRGGYVLSDEVELTFVMEASEDKPAAAADSSPKKK